MQTIFIVWSSRPEVFCEKAILKTFGKTLMLESYFSNFSKFAGLGL